MTARCSEPGCLNSEALDGNSRTGEEGLCELHRQRRRNAAGRCSNCGGLELVEPEPNTLTGRPLRDAQRRIVERRRCTSCGRTRRA